jgi:hypothetical protein
MEYQIIDKNKIEIQPGEISELKMLLSIARKSYETAIPRGMGFNKPYIHFVENMPNFLDYIKMKDESPVMLLMDYINGRDCRTKVFKDENEKWFLDSYAFQQRKVSQEEFDLGIVRDPADNFLDKVITEILTHKP